MEQDIKELVLTFGGILTGFALGEGASSIKSYKEVTRAGKSFDYEVAALKPVLVSQIEYLQKFLKEIENNDTQTTPTITILKKETYSYIDREKVVRYYSRKEKIEESLRLFNLRLNRIHVIESEIERFLNYYNDYCSKVEVILAKYADLLSDLKKEVTEYSLNAGIIDSYVRTIMDETLIEANDTNKNIVERKEMLHEKLFKLDVSKPSHNLHSPTRNFVHTGRQVMDELKAQNFYLLESINTITGTLTHCYKDLYEEFSKKSIS